MVHPPGHQKAIGLWIFKMCSFLWHLLSWGSPLFLLNYASKQRQGRCMANQAEGGESRIWFAGLKHKLYLICFSLQTLHPHQYSLSRHEHHGISEWRNQFKVEIAPTKPVSSDRRAVTQTQRTASCLPAIIHRFSIEGFCHKGPQLISSISYGLYVAAYFWCNKDNNFSVFLTKMSIKST